MLCEMHAGCWVVNICVFDRCEFWVLSCLQGRLCQIFGRKSRFLVSGPGIYMVSVIKAGSFPVPEGFRGGSCQYA
ncbi:unnamed protein product, partial [Prunus brigantina]